tara:strand:- start:121 stop:660 length:540 start_codon:yes stop_codon:yes gene_type:complete
MFGYIPKFILNDYLTNLKSEIIFNQDDLLIEGKQIKEERLTAWYSDYDYSYVYGGKTMNSNKMTKTLKKIQFAIELKYGIYFDSVLINYYKDGNSGMRYHSDATYNEWHQESVVVSFGSSRKIIFREINNFDNKTNIIMNSGDLLYMKEGCQDIYQHRVTKDKSISDERVSLVFKKHFK